MHRHSQSFACIFILACLAGVESFAATLTWTGAAGTSNIYDAGNWSPSQIPASGDLLVFSGTTGLTPSLANNLTAGSITFDTSAGAFSIGGGSTFTINSGGIVNNSSLSQTFNTAITLNAAQTWAANSGSLVINGNVSRNGSFLLTIGGINNTTVNGVISGAGGLSKSSTGTLTLNGANTYTGTTTLGGGIVQIGNDSAFGTSSVSVTSSTGKLEAFGGARSIANNITISADLYFQGANNLTLGGGLTLASSRTVNVTGTGLLSITGTISGSTFKLTKGGTGTLYLSGNNTFSGGYSASAGTSIIASSAAIGAGTLSLGTSTFQGDAAALTFGNLLSFSGNTTFAGSQNITFNGNGSLTATRTQTFNGSGVVTYNGVLSATSAYGYYKTGSGTVVFSGSAPNTYTGQTYVYDGQLILAKSSVNAFAGSLRIGDAVGLANSARVQLNASNQIPDATVLTIYPDGLFNLQSFTETVGATTLYGGSIVGSGTLGLNGNLTFSGTLGAQSTIDANMALNGDRTWTINDNGNTSTDLTVNGVVGNGSAASAITKAGAGNLLLTGANTFSGAFSITAGKVLLGSSTAGSLVSGPIGTGAVNLGNTSGSSTAALLFNTNSGLTIGNAITARSGGSGVLTLGGLNTSGIDTFTGNLLLNRTISLTAEAGGEVDFDGVISGVGGITKIGLGTVKLNSANTFSGTMTLSSGTLAVGANNALGSGALTLGGGTLAFGTNHTDTVGSVTLTSGSITGTGTLTSTGNFAVSAGSISVGLAGTGTFTKSTAGVVTLSGLSTYTGATTISAGSLELAQPGALAATTAVSISAGANLNLLGNDNQIGSLSGAGNVVLGTGTLTAGNNTSTSFTGVISGSGGLTKTGSGVLTLGGVNTYTGATTINAGTLRLGVANSINSASMMTLLSGSIFDLNNFAVTLGSLGGAGNVSQGSGALTVGGNGNSTTLSGILSGSGSLTKNGTGNLTLTGSDTLSGAVNVVAGKIIVTGSAGSLASVSSVTVRSGASLDLNNSTSENSNRLGNSSVVNMQGGNLIFSSDGNGTNESVGALNVVSGSSTVTVNHNGGALDSTSLTFSSLGTVTNGATVNFLSTGGVLGDSFYGPHVYITGQTSGTILGWATVGPDAAEYYAFGVRAYTEYYEGAVGINVNDITKLVRLSGNSSSSAYTLTRVGVTTGLGLNLTDIASVNLGTSTGNSLNLSSGSLIKSSSTATMISGSGTLTAGGTSAGNLNVSVTAGGDLTISAVITDNSGLSPVGLAKGDSGNLTLGGNNTFTGNVFINDGTVNISSEANLGAATNDVIFSGGTLHLGTGFTSNSAKIFAVNNGLTGVLDISSAQTLTLANTADVLVTGNTASTLVKTGAGSLVVQNANAGFDGMLKISNGTVELRNAQSLGDAANRGTVLLDGGTLALRSNVSTAYNNQITVAADSTIQVDRLSGSGAVTQTLGGLSIGGSILTIAGANSASLVLGNVNLTGAATFQTTTANAAVGAINGNFGFTKTGASSLTVADTSAYTGATHLDAGTLRLGAANVLPDGTALILAGGTTFDLADYSETIASLSGSGSTSLGTGTLSVGSVSSTYSGSISGTGGLVKTGAGTTTLGGVSSYSGETTVEAGTLALAGTNRLGSETSVTVAEGAVLNLLNNNTQISSIAGEGDVVVGSATLSTGSASSTFSGNISGTGNVNKIGSGTTVLSGDSSYTGATVINSGVVVARSTNALGAGGGGVTISTNAELQLENDTFLLAKPLTNSGTLRNNSGNNTYAGNITQAADSTIASNAGTLTVDGNLALAAKNLTVTGVGNVTLSGVVSGGSNSTLTKSGTGMLAIAGSNTYSGTTVIADGILRMDSSTALGAAGIGNGTAVSAGATLLIDQTGAGLSVAPENLTLNGNGLAGNGALRSASGDNIWSGDIALASNSTIRVDADTLTLDGDLSETGGARSLTKTGSGTVVLDGSTFNTGATNIMAGGVLLEESDRISDASALVVSSGASLDLNNHDETVGALSGAGNIQTGSTGGNTFTVGANNTTTNYSGIIQGSADFQKIGTGSITISGAQTYTGSTTVSGGKLNLTGTANATSGFSISSGGTLTGTGTTISSVAVNNGGTLTAGLSGVGQLDTGNITLNSGSTLLIEVTGSALSPYDSINLTGTANIAGDLHISLLTGYTPSYTLLNTYGFSNTGANSNLEKYFILINDGTDAIVGSFTNVVSAPGYFDGVPIVTLDGLQYVVTYTANSVTGSWIGGNDIAFIAVPEIGTFRAILFGSTILAGIQFRRRRRLIGDRCWSKHPDLDFPS